MKFQKREINKSDSNGGLFLKFKDGDSKTGVLRGEVYEYFQKWSNGRSSISTPDDPEAKSRFRLNFVVHEDGKFQAKIFEFGLMIYNNLADISDEMELPKTKVKITRRGTGTDTTYTIIPLGAVEGKSLPAIEAVPLNVLNHKDAKPLADAGAPFGPDEDGDLPF